MTKPTHIQAVILAGGSGTRLWPISREQLPKQFLSIDGGHTLLEATINCLQRVWGCREVARTHIENTAYPLSLMGR